MRRMSRKGLRSGRWCSDWPQYPRDGLVGHCHGGPILICDDRAGAQLMTTGNLIMSCDGTFTGWLSGTASERLRISFLTRLPWGFQSLLRSGKWGGRRSFGVCIVLSRFCCPLFGQLGFTSRTITPGCLRTDRRPGHLPLHKVQALTRGSKERHSSIRGHCGVHGLWV
jgi:hypothetical protein